MAIDKITTHQSDALRRLLEQYKNKPNLANFIKVYADQIQEVETLACDLFTSRTVDGAVGAQLDLGS